MFANSCAVALRALLFVRILAGLTRGADVDHNYYEIPIGIINDREGDESDEVKTAVRLAVDKHNENTLYLKLYAEQIDYAPPRHNVFQLKRDVCSLMSRGIFAMFNFGTLETYETMKTISDLFHLPYCNWNVNALTTVHGNKSFELSLKPRTHEIIADILIAKGWDHVTYVYDKPEGTENLQRINEILLAKANRTISAELRRLAAPEAAYSFFRALHLSKTKGVQRVILDISRSWYQKRILNALLEISSKSRNFHYLVVNYEINWKQLERFRTGFTNITGLRLMNRETNGVFKNFLALWRKAQFELNEISPEAAFAYDSIQIFTKALESLMQVTNYKFLASTFRNGQVYNGAKRGLSCDVNPQDKGVTHFELGQRIYNAMKQVKHDGITGKIQFDAHGKRRNFTVEVLELTFTTDENAASSSTLSSSPFVMEKKARDGEVFEGNDRYEGYCVDLLEKLAVKLEMDAKQLEIQLVKDTKYGGVGEDGVWNGMVGELLRNEADLAVAPLTISKLMIISCTGFLHTKRARERVVDFSKPFMTFGLSIMIKKPDKQEFSIFSFLSPFSGEIWQYLVLSYIGISLVIFIVCRFSPYEWRMEETGTGGFEMANDFGFSNCLWFTLAAFMQQGTDILPRSASGRIASSAWWFFTMIMIASYTANLAAFLTLEKMQSPIESVEELASQTRIRYGIQGGGSTAEFFRESTMTMYQKMWQYMQQQEQFGQPVYVKNYDEGIKRVRESKGKFALILESSTNLFTNNRIPCDTMRVGKDLNSAGYGVATAFGSPLKERVNLAILELAEKGELKKLENKWWYDRGQCEPPGAQDSSSASLNLSKVAGIFYVLILGLIGSIIGVFCEYLYRMRADRKEGANKPTQGFRSADETPDVKESKKHAST